MIMAIMNGHLDVVQYMLSIGCPSYTKDSSDNSAIHYAAGYGWNDILRALCKAPFANPGSFNMWKLSPFFIAMIKGHDLCASTLLETKDFDVNATDNEGKSILHYLLQHKNVNPTKSLKQLTRIVVELGAKVDVIMPKTKESPLHILANNAPSNKDSEMALVLMQKGARPDHQDKDGNTPISLAITHQNFDLIKTMILKFDINLAAKAQKAIDWKLEEKKQRLRLNGDEDEEQDDKEEISRELNLNKQLKSG